MWEPQPGWQPLPTGPSGSRLWRAETEGRAWVVKRLERPGPDDHPVRSRPDHPAYWCREAEVARSPEVVDGPGLVPAGVGRVEEDDQGVAVWTVEVVGTPPTGLQVARCLGRFAAEPYAAPSWASRHLLRRRLELVEQGGGWRTLARTTLADVTDRLWDRRGHWLDRLDALPQGRVHGDAVPSNFLATRADTVVTADWQSTGVGPVGADVGYWSLSAREDLEVLLDAFAVDGVDRDAASLAAQVTAAYTVLSRAERALAQAARGEGALAGKFRHPSVAPYLRAVQRHFPQLEALL